MSQFTTLREFQALVLGGVSKTEPSRLRGLEETRSSAHTGPDIVLVPTSQAVKHCDSLTLCGEHRSSYLSPGISKL